VTGVSGVAAVTVVLFLLGSTLSGVSALPGVTAVIGVNAVPANPAVTGVLM
jgi:hypothetical protein